MLNQTNNQPSASAPRSTNRARIATMLAGTLIGGSLLLASGCGDASAKQEASAAGSSANAPSTPLDQAIITGDNDAVRAHIIAGTPIDEPNAMGDTPLSLAAVFGRAYAAEVLIDAGADLESRNRSGATPLFNAAFFCEPEVLKLLIDAGADTATTDANGYTVGQVMETPWAQIRPVYEGIYRAINLPFDADRIEKARPEIARMLD